MSAPRRRGVSAQTATGALGLALVLGVVMVAALAVAPAGADADAGALIIPAYVAAAAAALAAVLLLDTAWIMTAALGLSVFSGHWPDIGSPLPLDRLCFAAGVASLLTRVPLDPRRWTLPPVRAVHIALAAAAIWVLMSAWAAGTIGHRKTQFEILDAHGLLPFFYLVTVPFVYDTQRRRMILMGGLVGVAGYLGLVAFLEGTNLDSLVFPRYITDPNFTTHIDRARGPFIEAGAMGLALIGGVVSAAVLFVTTHRRAVKITCALVAALCLLGIVFSLTRAVWIGGGAAAIVTLLAVPRLRRLFPLALITVTLGVGGAYVLVPGLPAKIQTRNNDSVSVWSRLNSNAAGVRMFEQRPLLGWGYDTFAFRSEPFYRLSPDHPLNGLGDLHEVFLGNLVELGMIGTGVWLVALLVALGTGATGLRRAPPYAQAWKAGALAYAVAWAVDANFTPLTYPYPNILLWFFAGLAIWPVRDPPAA